MDMTDFRGLATVLCALAFICCGYLGLWAESKTVF